MTSDDMKCKLWLSLWLWCCIHIIITKIKLLLFYLFHVLLNSSVYWNYLTEIFRIYFLMQEQKIEQSRNMKKDKEINYCVLSLTFFPSLWLFRCMCSKFFSSFLHSIFSYHHLISFYLTPFLLNLNPFPPHFSLPVSTSS